MCWALEGFKCGDQENCLKTNEKFWMHGNNMLKFVT